MTDTEWELHRKVFDLILFELKGLLKEGIHPDQVALDITEELFEDFVILPYYGDAERT